MSQVNFTNIKIVIPSYKRYNIKTITFLQSCNIPIKQIYIFVANQDEYNIYKLAYPEYKIIIGALGLANQRNFINNYFKNGSRIVSFDDDIENFFILDTNTNKLEKYIYLKEFITMGFRTIQDCGARIFGVSQTDNAYFMKESITHDLTFIIGHFFGYINSNDTFYNLTNDQKEDYERSIKYFIKDKVLVKFNNYCFKTNTYKNEGGMQTNPNRIEDSNNRVNELLLAYPEYIFEKVNSKSKFREISLRRIPSSYKIVSSLPTLADNDNELVKLLCILETTIFKINKKRLQTGIGYSTTFGLGRIRRKAGLFPTKNNELFPELYNALNTFAIAKLPTDFTYTSIQVNKDYKARPHRDILNKGISYIIGLGNYTSGSLIVNGKKYNIKNTLCSFDASKWLHSVDDFQNTRYSICYFTL
jgi:hypothetical protein